MVLTAKEALVITPSVAFARESTRFACISSANNASMKSWVYLNSAFLLRAAIGFSRRVTSAGGRLLFFQSVFNLLLHIMHLFPSDRPPSILFAKKFRIHDSFIATPPQKMRGTLSRRLRRPRRQRSGADVPIGTRSLKAAIADAGLSPTPPTILDFAVWQAIKIDS